MENVDGYLEIAKNLALTYAPRLFFTLAVLIIGLGVIKFLVKLVKRALEHKAVDDTLEVFLGSLISWTLKIILFVAVGSMLGVATTSFVALLAGGTFCCAGLPGSIPENLTHHRAGWGPP